jgi:hypothetical protein
MSSPQYPLDVNGTARTGHHLPTANDTYDLGAVGNRWRDLYLSAGSIYLGTGSKISSTADAEALMNLTLTAEGVTLTNGTQTGTIYDSQFNPPTVLPSPQKILLLVGGQVVPGNSNGTYAFFVNDTIQQAGNYIIQVTVNFESPVTSGYIYINFNQSNIPKTSFIVPPTLITGSKTTTYTAIAALTSANNSDYNVTVDTTASSVGIILGVNAVYISPIA